MTSSVSLYLVIVLAAVLPNYIWRFFGVVFAARLDETSEILRWVNAVATSLIAALVARMVIAPPGPLESSLLLARILALAAGIVVYWFGKRNLGLSVAASIVVLIGLNWLLAAA